MVGVHSGHSLEHTCQTQARYNVKFDIILRANYNVIASQLACGVYCAVTAAGPTTNSKHNSPYQQNKMQVNLQLITVSYIRKHYVAKPCKWNML